MSVLDNAKDWALNNLVDEDTLAILLVGSWARGTGNDTNDIDLIIIKQYQLMGIYHQEHKQDEFTLDIWVNDKDAMHQELFEPLQDLNNINNVSMIISALKEAVIWFEKESFIDAYIEKSKNWTWDQNYIKLLEFNSSEPIVEWAKNAYNENISLLDTAKTRLKEGKPIGHRRKDYPELKIEKSEDFARKVMELTLNAYKHLGVEREWSEFADAKKAMNQGNWSDCVGLLKDVLRFMIRYELPAVPEQLLDPAIWKATEEMTLSDEITAALQKIYS